MMKRSSFRTKNASLLYEYARNDLFLNPIGATKTHQKLIMSNQPGPNTSSGVRQNGNRISKAPSITAMFLLQLEVNLIQMISGLPAKPPRNVMFASVIGRVQKAVRWTFLFGLVVLDYVSQVLGVDNEMDMLSQNMPDPIMVPLPDPVEHHQHQVDLQVVHLESSAVCFDEQNIEEPKVGGDIPVEVLEEEEEEGEDMPKHACNACSSSKLPARTRKTSVPARTGSARSGHVRSLSNNMTLPVRHASSLGHGHSLRRIEGQRNLVSVNPSTASSSSLSQRSNPATDIHCHHHNRHHHQDSLVTPRRSTSTHI